MINNMKHVSVVFPDPAADETIPVLKVPTDRNYTIESAIVALAADLAGSTDNYVEFNLVNMGTDGLGTDEIATVAGGTDGWTENVPIALVVTAGSGKLTAGQILGVKYAETGTVAPALISAIIDYVDGIGAKANA